MQPPVHSQSMLALDVPNVDPSVQEALKWIMATDPMNLQAFEWQFATTKHQS